MPFPVNDAPAMTCPDAREKLSALRRGMDLTERALVHAHVMQCEECRQEREEQPQPVASAPTGAAHVSLTVAEVARAGVARTAGVLTQVEHVRSGLTRSVHGLIQLRSPLMTAVQGTARAVIDPARAGVPRVLDVLARLRELLSIALTVSGQAAARVAEVVLAGLARGMGLTARVSGQLPGLAASLLGQARFGIARCSHRLMGTCSSLMSELQSAARATTDALRAGMTGAFALPTRLMTTGRALSVRAAHAFPLRAKQVTVRPARPALRVGIGIVSLAILVAAIVFSAGERFSPDVRLPAALEPSFAEISAPMPVSALPPAPVEVSRPEARPVSVRPRSPEAARAAAALTPSTEAAAQNADASDPTAAIDWLLQGGRGRRQTDKP